MWVNVGVQFSSVQFSYSVVSDSLWSHELQHTRPPCLSPTPGVHPSPRPSSRWSHPTISSSVITASGSFQMSQLFASGGQRTEVSASASVLPMNTQDWSSLGWTGWISLQPKGLSRVFSNTAVQKHQFFSAQLSLESNSHPYMTTGKTIALTDTDSRAAPMKSSCQNIEQKSEQGPASIHQFIENNEAGGTWRRSCTGNQNTLKQFYRKNNLVSSANEGPGKVPGLGRWGNHCRVKWDISTKSHGGPCLDPHPNKLSVKKTFVRQPNPKKSTGCAMIRRSYS